MDELGKLVSLSRYAGERFDLIQAGGGNSSVKRDDGTMAIKASGYSLSDLTAERGYSIVNNQEVIEILSNPSVLNSASKRDREALSNEMLQRCIITPGQRPSIETYLHALMAKYTLHTHPVTVNAVTCLPDWQEHLIHVLGKDIMFVPYGTPGIELALLLQNELSRYQSVYQRLPKITFLQNHGLIVSSDIYEEAMELTDWVTIQLERYLKLDFKHYRMTNTISRIVNKIANTNLIAYYSDDRQINRIVSSTGSTLNISPYFPDGLVFLGYRIINSNIENMENNVRSYLREFHEPPKVISIDGNIYLIAPNVRKAREMEEVLKLHLFAITSAPGEIHSLPLEELKYLGNWEAEKYRQSI